MKEVTHIVNLSEAVNGKNYRIEEMDLAEDTKHRLFALGLTEGTVIFLEEKNKGPMIIRARGTRLAMGEKFCRGIKVREMGI